MGAKKLYKCWSHLQKETGSAQKKNKPRGREKDSINQGPDALSTSHPSLEGEMDLRAIAREVLQAPIWEERLRKKSSSNTGCDSKGFSLGRDNLNITFESANFAGVEARKESREDRPYLLAHTGLTGLTDRSTSGFGKKEEKTAKRFVKNLGSVRGGGGGGGRGAAESKECKRGKEGDVRKGRNRGDPRKYEDQMLETKLLGWVQDIARSYQRRSS